MKKEQFLDEQSNSGRAGTRSGEVGTNISNPRRADTVNRPVSYGTTAGNQVAVCFEPDNLETCLKMINSPVTGEAMAADGVLKDTVKIFVLDKELKS